MRPLRSGGRQGDFTRTEPLVRLHACGELDWPPMRRAEIGALPLVLTLVEFRARDAAVFRKHPLKRREHRAVVGLAIVGLGFERLDLCPERLGPSRAEITPRLTRRSAKQAFPRATARQTPGSPSLALRNCPSSGRFKIALPQIDEDAIAASLGFRPKVGGSEAHGIKVLASLLAMRRCVGQDMAAVMGVDLFLPCPAHIRAGAYGQSRRRAGIARFSPSAKRGGVLTLTAKLLGDLTKARAASGDCGGMLGLRREGRRRRS